MKKLLLTTALAAALVAPSAFADTNSNSGVNSGSGTLLQNTGSGAIYNGSGAGGTTNSGGAGGVASATANPTVSPTISPIIAPVNVNAPQGGDGGSASAAANNSNRVDTIDVNAVDNRLTSSQEAKTGDQAVNIKYPKAPVSTAYAPGLVAGFDCLGSKSGGASFAPVSLSLGGTEADPTCVNVFVSRYLAERGEAKESWLAGCFIEQVRAVRALAGNPCPNLDVVASSARGWESESAEWRDRSGYPASGNASKH